MKILEAKHLNKHDKIFVAGHMGLIGSAIVRKLKADGYANIVTIKKNDLDLRNQYAVNNFFQHQQPDYIFLTAALVGGIKANNTRRAEFIYDNTMIQSNVIHAAYLHGAKKLLFTGSACIYPTEVPQPIIEEYLLTGKLEPTNEPYAVAKINGMKMCQAYHSQYKCNFISAMPTNSYGPNDHYDLDNSHVMPALLRKIITAKENDMPSVEMWGTGNARREFIYSDDMADALVFLMNNYDSEEIINVGTGTDISIKQLAEEIKDIVKWDGEFVYNNNLDGMMRRKLDVLKMKNLGWTAKTSLREGIKQTVKDIYQNKPW